MRVDLHQAKKRASGGGEEGASAHFRVKDRARRESGDGG